MKAKLTLIISALVMAGTALAGPEIKEIYDKNCAKCHGVDGKGNTRMGRQTGAKDYTDPKVQAEMKDETAMKVLKEGLVENGKKKMDPYKDKLTDDELKALIAYLRTFKK